MKIHPVPSYPGYGVTEEGRVWSYKSERFLKTGHNADGYERTNLSVNGIRHDSVSVHRLMADAFMGTPPEGKNLVLHCDGNPANNALSNLRWGSHSENVRDSVVHGTHHMSRRTHCPQGHEYTEGNTYRPPDKSSRWCRKCQRSNLYARSKTGLPDGDPKHGTNYGYAGRGCRCSECLQARRNYLENLKH